MTPFGGSAGKAHSLPNHMNTQNAEYAVGWFTLSMINAGLAQSKGRSRSNWWLASLFLGPIATFLIVVTDAEADKK